jgi:hypothetical protein
MVNSGKSKRGRHLRISIAQQKDRKRRRFRRYPKRIPDIGQCRCGLSYPIYDRLRFYGKVGGAYYLMRKPI